MTLTTVKPRPLRARLAARGARLGYVVWFPLAVYALTRLVDVVLILLAARHQIAMQQTDPGLAGYHIWKPFLTSPGYGSVASNWDGQWYLSIASHGYPATIPHDAAGRALQNEWGFYPVYPLIVGGVTRMSGLSVFVVAPLLSFVLGAVAVVVLFRLVNQVAGRFTASATVLLACTYMAAPAMQIAYTESLALLLLCTALLLLRNRRYGWVVLAMVTLALTRAVALPFVPVVIAHYVSRYRRRLVEPFPLADRWQVLGLAALAVAATGLWPTIAAAATGDPGAYTQTMSSWGTTGKLRVLVEFPVFAWVEGSAAGLAILLGGVALVSVLVLRKGARAWGPELRAWAGFYPLYLLLATAPGSSNVRHLFLAFPLMWPFPSQCATRADGYRRIATVTILAICGLLTQWVWLSQFLVLTGHPAGRPYP